MGEADKLPPEQIAGIREFLHRWATTGPILEDIRYAELRDMSQDQVRQASNDLLAFRRQDSATTWQKDSLPRRPSSRDTANGT